MSHPAELLKRYLTDLSDQIVKSDATSGERVRTVNETIDQLDVKLDSSIQIASEAIGRIDSKVDSDSRSINNVVGNLGSKMDTEINAMKESINRLSDKLDASVQTTNQAIGDLYREKLSVREFREFVDAFYEILAEDLPSPKKPSTETKRNTSQDNGTTSSSPTAVQVNPQIIIESPPSNPAKEEAPSTAGTVEAEMDEKHVGFPMKVAGEYFYVGDGVTSIVGDVEIPPGTIVDETLVVRGNFKSRESCLLKSNVKALKDIEIGSDTTIEGTLVSGGKVTLHPNCFVKGSIESDGNVEIGDNVIVTENISSKSSVILSKSAQVYRPIHAAKGVLRP